MSGLQITLGIILIIFSVAIILVVLLQEGHQSNAGVIEGGADSFFSKGKAHTVDEFLNRWTKFIAIGFFIAIIVVNAILFFA